MKYYTRRGLLLLLFKRIKEGERPLSGEIGNLQIGKASKCRPPAEETMQTGRANSSQVNPWTYPLLGVFTAPVGVMRPGSSATLWLPPGDFSFPQRISSRPTSRAPSAITTLFQSLGICTLISDQWPKLQGLRLSCALRCRSCGRCRGFRMTRASGICRESFPPST